MSQGRAAGRKVAATILRDIVPYGVASVAAACTVVVGVWVHEEWQGRDFAVGELPQIVVFASIITFIYAVPVSAVLIAIGEWRGFGVRFFTVAGFLSALLTYGGLVLLVPGGIQPVAHFVFVAVGGAVGGYVFWRLRKLLVDRLGDLGGTPVA